MLITEAMITATTQIMYAVAYTISFIWVIQTFMIKNQGKADFKAVTHVVGVVIILASFPIVRSTLLDISDSVSKGLGGTGESTVSEYARDRTVDMNKLINEREPGWKDIGEKISIIIFFIGRSLAEFINQLFYDFQNILLNIIGFIFPLYISMSLYDSHKGKKIMIFGWILQIALWPIGWAIGWAFITNAFEGVGMSGYAGLASVAIILMLAIPIYSLATIFLFQKVWEMGISAVGGSGFGVGNIASGAAGALRATPTGLAASAAGVAIGGAASLAASGGSSAKSAGSKFIQSVRSNGVVKPVSSPPPGGGSVPPINMARR